jgi:hypothetical protein
LIEINFPAPAFGHGDIGLIAAVALGRTALDSETIPEAVMTISQSLLAIAVAGALAFAPMPFANANEAHHAGQAASTGKVKAAAKKPRKKSQVKASQAAPHQHTSGTMGHGMMQHHQAGHHMMGHPIWHAWGGHHMMEHGAMQCPMMKGKTKGKRHARMACPMMSGHGAGPTQSR